MAGTLSENDVVSDDKGEELSARLNERPSNKGACSGTDDDDDDDDDDDNDDDDNQEVEVQMIVPPDGGWGWVIVAASFMCNVVVDGIIFSFGAFLPQIGEHFAVSNASVAMVGSLQTGFYLITGPIVSALTNKYGFRLVAMLGALISSIAFVLSFFSPSVRFLYFSYGVLGGIGSGMIYVPAVISAGFYFERWRALATGIAVCGSGIGGFILAPISDMLIKHYGWRGALLIQAGMLLNCAVFGALLRPLKPTRVKVNAVNDKSEIEMGPLSGKSGSLGCLYTIQPPGRRLLGTNNNTEYSTAAQLIGSSPNIVNCRSLHSLHKESHAMVKNEKYKNRSVDGLAAPIYPESPVLADQDLKTVEEENNLLSGDLQRLNGRIPTTRRHTVCGRRHRSGSDVSQKSQLRRHANTGKDNIQRPFYRDDIFYGGSLSRLPHYRSQVSSVGYHMSVTRLPTEADIDEEESGSCYFCPEGVRRILATMLDVSLLKSPSFLILAISGSLTMLGFYTPFTYLPDRAKQSPAEIDESTAMLLLSLIGICNTIGRVVCGLATSLSGIDALMLNNVFISVSGIATIFSGISLSKEYQFFYASIFGLSISAFAALRSILVVDLMGLEKLTNGFGLILLFQGVAAVIGSPLAGWFKDITGTYDVSFYFSGSLILASAVICYPLGRINRWEKLRESKRNSVEAQ